jgi:hypothetical protein
MKALTTKSRALRDFPQPAVIDFSALPPPAKDDSLVFGTYSRYLEKAYPASERAAQVKRVSVLVTS